MGKKVGITYDLKTDWVWRESDPKDANAELDSMETVNSITAALEKAGHKVVPVGNVRQLLSRLPDLGVDIVFNICEGQRGRNRESQVPIILEMNDVPFVGADALTLGVTLDKILAKKCFIADNIPTPGYFEAWHTDDLEKMNTLGFPLFVKPRYEGTSKGLTEQSRVTDYQGLRREVKKINDAYHQGALVEQFIRGTEYTVPVLGNDKPQPMPVLQVSIEGKTELGDKFFTYEYVTTSEARLNYVCPAPISAELMHRLQETAVRAYKSVGCRDFGRVDFRMDEKGTPYVLEINPLPSLALKDAFNIFPNTIGSSYNEIVSHILDLALERYGMGSAKTLRSLANQSRDGELTVTHRK